MGSTSLPEWFRPHPDDVVFTEEQALGDRDTMLCSRCLNPILDDYVPIMFFSENGNRVWQYHDECLGIKTEAVGEPIEIEYESDFEDIVTLPNQYEDETRLNLGACCACGQEKDTTHNVLMLDKLAPQPGTGWGCVVCGLPQDGAVAIVCDNCLTTSATINYVVDGFATDKKRKPYSTVENTSFEHDLSKHEEAEI